MRHKVSRSFIPFLSSIRELFAALVFILSLLQRKEGVDGEDYVYSLELPHCNEMGLLEKERRRANRLEESIVVEKRRREEEEEERSRVSLFFSTGPSRGNVKSEN